MAIGERQVFMVLSPKSLDYAGPCIESLILNGSSRWPSR